MRRTPLLVFILLLLPSLSMAQSSMELHEGEMDLRISLETGYINPLESEPELFLCRQECRHLEISSFSYSAGSMDFFVLPEVSGDYNLKIFMTVNGEEVVYEKEISISREYTKSETQEKNQDVTANIMRNAASPVVGLGLLASVLLLFLFKTEGFGLKKSLLPMPKNGLKILTVFLVSFLFLSSFTHELFHIFLAGMFSCPAVLESFIPVFTPTSVSLQACRITSVQSILILAAGVVGNLVLGGIFCILARLKKKSFLSVISLALFSSSFLYLFYTTGDIHSIMSILNIGISQIYLDATGIALILVTFIVFLRTQNRGTYPRYQRNM
ncbi:MAG: hypothetical protein JSV92_02575 [archaeon]|nr:MAG: hypothetical protein JSV92_02575 [archaeon]